MYSLILLSAMAPGVDVTPAPAAAAPVVAGCFGGCTGVTVSLGCAGCYGGGGCFGYACNGCYGSSSCLGCLGSAPVRHHRPRLLNLFRRSCLGCDGFSCHGYSCYGSCLGFGGCTGCAGCLGSLSCFGVPVAMPHYYSGMAACPQVTYGTVTHPNPPGVVVPPSEPKPMTEPKPTEPKKTGASIRFQLPADAKLIVDGRPTNSTGTERAFTTPPLAAGRKFFYDVRAEVVVGGVTVVETKRVIVEAGANITETFSKLFAAVDKPGTAVAGK